MGWCWRLGGIPQETPVNQEKKQKTVSYKMPAPGSLPSPNANHFINLCLIKWLVWNYPQLDTYPHSPGNAPLFFPSPRSFGSTQSSRRFLPILPQHSLTMFFSTFWSMFYGFCPKKAGRLNSQIRSSCCLKWSLSSVTKWLSRRHIVRNRPFYKMIRPAKNTPATKWHGSVLQNATFFSFKCLWNRDMGDPIL